MLKIGGFDQKLDGDCELIDCSVGNRLDLAGYGARLALFRDIFLIRIPTQVGKWNDAVQKNRVSIKCNFPLLQLNRFFGTYKANVKKLEEYEISWMKNVCCKEQCMLRETCRKENPFLFPFQYKPNPEKENISSEKWWNFWKENIQLIDLKAERKLRLSGDKYQEGTFI